MANPVNDEASLIAAVEAANADVTIKKIIFTENASITLTAPVIYTGSQAIKFMGHNAIIDGSSAGDLVFNEDLTAVTEDGSLIFNTSSDVSIDSLSVINSKTRGVVVNIPEYATGKDITVKLNNVNIIDSALYGLHIDDNADEFDDGVSGSAIGIKLKISHSNFIGNGTGAIDFDGIRVDERGEGSIKAKIKHTHIDGNGGDGIELDEAGAGSVDAEMKHVTLNGNGFYDPTDLDDGFDIDEAGDGDIKVELKHVEVKNNMDEGLDFDEEGNGSVEAELSHVIVMNNNDEGIKIDEEDAGDIEAELEDVSVIGSGDDGIQFTEIGEGKIEAELESVTAIDNNKYGIKIEQWFVEDEYENAEAAGSVKIEDVTLSGNRRGDTIKVNNIIIK